MKSFEESCVDMTELIESCWDENNPKEGLSFDERLQRRLNENPELKEFSNKHHICD